MYQKNFVIIKRFLMTILIVLSFTFIYGQTIITSVADLDRIVRDNLDGNFRLANDLNLDSYENWIPIGNTEEPFTGTFDGNGNMIRNLRIDTDTPQQGLFGVTNGATIMNLSLPGASIRVFDQPINVGDVGVLIARANSTTIINCSSTGHIESRYAPMLGGLIGFLNNSLITDSWSTVNIEFDWDRAGGLIGYAANSTIKRCWSFGDIRGRNGLGGLIGTSTGSLISNCYSRTRIRASFTPSATGRGGLIGSKSGCIVEYSYSTGNVQGSDNRYIGGLVGGIDNQNINDCYYNYQTSGQTGTPGFARTTTQMTYQYDPNTFVNWDFNTIWEADVNFGMNAGYPYLREPPSPNPTVAIDPIPTNNSSEIELDLENLGWSYYVDEAFTNPLGFRVYFNTTDEFDEEEFVWVEYVEDQVEYTTSEILPEQLDYFTYYYWKVVPTTIDPFEDDDDENSEERATSRVRFTDRGNQSLYRGDAIDVPVWRFVTSPRSYPTLASNPQPEDGAIGVPINFDRLRWSYIIDPSYSNPIGFRIYINTTGEFSGTDNFFWRNFAAHQADYTLADFVDGDLDYATTYYWKVVPTTDTPPIRGDAIDALVWSFTTPDANPFPLPAKNPQPPDLANGVSPRLVSLSWDYEPVEFFADPAGFRVYMNTTGTFNHGHPYEWVDYVENQVTYSCSDVIPEILNQNTRYYWLVVPTTITPESFTAQKRNHNGLPDKDSFNYRGDAENTRVWRFTTGVTNIDEDLQLPAITKLNSNFPNPFNPQTTISFDVAEAGNIKMEIFNSRSQKVKTIIDSFMLPGSHTTVWNGKDMTGKNVGSGIYYLRMTTDEYTFTNKMILMK